MPDSALYWYGNECTHNTNGWTAFSYNQLHAYKRDTYLEINSSGGYSGHAWTSTNDTIDLSTYTKMCMIYSRSVVNYNLYLTAGTAFSNDVSTWMAGTKGQLDTPKTSVTKVLFANNMPSVYLSEPLYVSFAGDNTGYCYALWLE